MVDGGVDNNSMYKIVRRQRIDIVAGPYCLCLVFVTFLWSLVCHS